MSQTPPAQPQDEAALKKGRTLFSSGGLHQGGVSPLHRSPDPAPQSRGPSGSGALWVVAQFSSAVLVAPLTPAARQTSGVLGGPGGPGGQRAVADRDPAPTHCSTTLLTCTKY